MSEPNEECEACQRIAEHLEVKSPKKPLTKAGKIILGIAGGSFVLVTAVTTPFLMPALRRVCLPFVPATTNQVNNVMKFLEGSKGKLIDLGSGDGRIVRRIYLNLNSDVRSFNTF